MGKHLARINFVASLLLLVTIAVPMLLTPIPEGYRQLSRVLAMFETPALVLVLVGSWRLRSEKAGGIIAMLVGLGLYAAVRVYEDATYFWMMKHEIATGQFPLTAFWISALAAVWFTINSIYFLRRQRNPASEKT